MSRRLYRSRTDSMLGGVAGGVADYLDVDPSLVRIIWAVLAVLTGGVLIVLYVVMWIVVPHEPRGAPGPAAAGTASPDWEAAGERIARSGSAAGPMILGLILIGLGAYFLLERYVPGIDFEGLWPIGLVALGAVLLLLSLRRRAQ